MIYCSFFTEKGKKGDFQHSAAHALLSHGMLLEHSISYSEEMLSRKKNGKPFFADYPDIHFNLSHCSGGAACIIDSVPVGIDIENVRPFHERTARRVCTEAELEYICGSQDPNRSFFKLWTLKESAVKASGTGITVPLINYSFLIDGNNEIISNHPEYSFSLFEFGKFVVSVCKTV